MSLRSERICLVTDEDLIHSSIEALTNPHFGPCSISPEALDALRLALKSHSTGAEPKKVIFALLGKVVGKRWHITHVVQLIGAQTPTAATHSFSELRKVEAEAASQGLSFIGLLHSHPQIDSCPTPQPSPGDKLSYLVMLGEFKRPIIFFIINPRTFELCWLSISLEDFLHLQDCIKCETLSIKGEK